MNLEANDILREKVEALEGQISAEDFDTRMGILKALDIAGVSAERVSMDSLELVRYKDDPTAPVELIYDEFVEKNHTNGTTDSGLYRYRSIVARNIVTLDGQVGADVLAALPFGLPED